MRPALRLGLLIIVGMVARAQDGEVAQLSSHAKYFPLARQARIEGEVMVRLSRAPGGAVNAVKTGHPLLVPGVEPDADRWKEWAAMGIEQVDYVFKINPPASIATKVEIPRNRLIRLFPWVKKTRTVKRTEWQQQHTPGVVVEKESSGNAFRITITVDPPTLMTTRTLAIVSATRHST